MFGLITFISWAFNYQIDTTNGIKLLHSAMILVLTGLESFVAVLFHWALLRALFTYRLKWKEGRSDP